MVHTLHQVKRWSITVKGKMINMVWIFKFKHRKVSEKWNVDYPSLLMGNTMHCHSLKLTKLTKYSLIITAMELWYYKSHQWVMWETHPLSGLTWYTQHKPQKCITISHLRQEVLYKWESVGPSWGIYDLTLKAPFMVLVPETCNNILLCIFSSSNMK